MKQHESPRWDFGGAFNLAAVGTVVVALSGGRPVEIGDVQQPVCLLLLLLLHFQPMNEMFPLRSHLPDLFCCLNSIKIR